MKLNALVRGLVAAFNRRKPVRAGSLIVALYGDAIVPRGGSLSLGDISQIMALFRIDGGHVRTAISRLTSEKWLERRKSGRNTYYRLSKEGEGEFARATQRIYFARRQEEGKQARLALLNGGPAGRAVQRKQIEAEGFVAFNALTYVSAEGERAPKPIKGVHYLEIPPSDEAIEVVRVAYGLDDLAARYREFAAQFEPLRAALANGEALEDGEALIVRLLLIQEFRRIVLREPELPASMLPKDWPGDAARKLAAEIYSRVLVGSERYLDGCQADETHSLPKPNSSLSQRFAAMQ